MSSTTDCKRETKETINNSLSLFDQLKNSVDHNSVTKTSLSVLTRDEKNAKKTEINLSEEETSTKSISQSKPEFQTPSLPSSVCSVSSSTILNNLGNASAKRSTNASANVKFPLKPPSSSLTSTLRSLKRSQPPSLIQKTGSLSLAATASSSSLLSTQASPATLAAAAAALRHSSGGALSSTATTDTGNSTALINHNAKKKRCTDRYDSSESSDSGVATSLSCTDSSTGSSEDASEPGSPFSPQSSLSAEDQQQHQQTKSIATSTNISNTNKMSPQTILVASGGASNNTKNTSSTTSNTSASASAVLNAAIRSSNLPASLTITATGGGGGGSHSNSVGNANKVKLPMTQITKSNNNNNTANNTNRCSNVPTLQWPWTTSVASPTSTTLPPCTTFSSATSCTSTTGTNTHITHSVATSAPNSSQAKKRIATNAGAPGADANKKARSNANAQIQDNNHHLLTASAAKRLKAAALEESQTKITGYFKSQMKAQMQAANNCKTSQSANNLHASVMMTTTAAANTNHSSNSSMTTNALTMSAPATTASLNKYFNILAQLKENSKAANSMLSNSNTIVATPPPPAMTPAILPATTQNTLATVTTSYSNTSVGASANKPQNLTMSSPAPVAIPATPVQMPALKKIERPKPTKIAQVAPNLRKTPTNSSYGTSLGKSPAKKHVAIAPRTPEMKQQQQQLLTNKQENNKQTQVLGNQATVAQTSGVQQPVLLTAIRLPQTNNQTQSGTQTKQSVPTNKLNSSATVAGNTLTNNTPAHTNTSVSAPPNATTLYQLPAVQLPNLVQLPQLLAANGANIMQLNNMAASANIAKNTNNSNAASAAASSAQAQAQAAAAAQYFLNGTVFKLQQFTTATTTTATTAATGNMNPYNLMSAADLNDMLIKQQQVQLQQLHQQQQQQQKAVASANANSFQEIFQQQIVAAMAANQQQAQLQQLQRLGATANLQQQPVFMATPAGLLLNAASLPAMLAQAAAALAANSQQQKALALPALQPIQQAPLPALSSIFAPQNEHELHQQQQQMAHLALQQQFITPSQPPPLSSVAMTTANLTHNTTSISTSNLSISNTLNAQANNLTSQTNNTAKLAIVKSSVAPPTYSTLSSQPPPLVTISNAKTRTHLNNTSTTNSGCTQKPSVMAKPYQKRTTKAQTAGNQAKSSIKSNSTGKITTPCGKILASPTTPPPLVPTLTSAVPQPVSLTTMPAPGIRSATATNLTKPIQMPTPALVSIAPTTPIAPKPAQSITCGSVTITPTSTASKNLVNIAPKVTTSVGNSNTTQTSFKFSNKISNTKNSPTTCSSVAKTKAPMAAKTTASDLFDLVKNSNGAISITPTAAMTTIYNANIAHSSTPNFCSPYTFKAVSSVAEPKLESFGKIKDEPIDDIPAICNVTNVINSVATTIVSPTIAATPKDVKYETNPTSFSGQIPSNIDIKEELMHTPTEREESEKSCSPLPLNNLNNECSSSSFSSNSNSISSAADLSLEGSTPASISSNSEAPSPACSMLSPLNINSNEFVVPNPCSTSSNAATDPNSSNSCETGGASSRDMLSEMVTSTCISSDSSEASISVSMADNEEVKTDSMDEAKCSEELENKQRDLPTPESGIGGSLSNNESMDSSSKSSACDIASSASSSSSSSSAEQVPASPTSDTQTPPPTPMNVDSNCSSMEETQNNTSSSQSTQQSEDSSSKSYDWLTTTIDTSLAESSSADLPKCAMSPILSQPKTIRFPVTGKNNKRHDGICYWDKCNKKHDSNSKLLDHMQHHHVNSQTGPFACLWVGCKVYSRESCSRRWLERHVLSHGGSKQFKCIVEGCGLRFGSQLALQKHINNHFTATENKESTNKRTSDPPVPKQLRKNGKKLRYRRQPFSARMFDFFDAGIMEGLQHRLRQISTLTNGCNSITFQGQCIMRRTAPSGKTECYVQWSPREIISDEWLPECEEAFLKTVNIKHMKPSEKNKVESLLMTAYKLPYSPTIFENDYALSQQHQRLKNEHNAEAKNAEDESNDKQVAGDNAEDSDEDEDENDDEDDDETATTAETISSYQHVLSITNIQMQQRRKHPRKSQNHVYVTR